MKQVVRRAEENVETGKAQSRKGRVESVLKKGDSRKAEAAAEVGSQKLR